MSVATVNLKLLYHGRHCHGNYETESFEFKTVTFNIYGAQPLPPELASQITFIEHLGTRPGAISLSLLGHKQATANNMQENMHPEDGDKLIFSKK